MPFSAPFCVRLIVAITVSVTFTFSVPLTVNDAGSSLPEYTVYSPAQGLIVYLYSFGITVPLNVMFAVSTTTVGSVTVADVFISPLLLIISSLEEVQEMSRPL